MQIPAPVNVAQLPEFDEIIDVRSESEFAEDHIPGAINCPVLSDEERVRVGTLYKQVSTFDAKKAGAVLVSRNIARHIESRFSNQKREWRPLIYCWRGGNRSAALAHVLQQIGWRARQLDGGYRAYRRAVIADLNQLPARFAFRVVCGLTGSGKSRLLRALNVLRAQVLDLEGLARHRGSVLGNLPGEPQPGQKMFESLLWHALRRFDPAHPVYVEAESKRIGLIRVPEPLINAMWRGSCVRIETPTPQRIAMLKQEYDHFISNTPALLEQLTLLVSMHGRQCIEHWQALATGGDHDALVRELLEKHYDPAYTRSTLQHYPEYARCSPYSVIDVSDDGFACLARNLLHRYPPTLAGDTRPARVPN